MCWTVWKIDIPSTASFLNPCSSSVACHTHPTALFFHSLFGWQVLISPSELRNSATAVTWPVFQRKHLSWSSNWGEAVWDHLHPTLAVKSQNMTPLSQKIIWIQPSHFYCLAEIQLVYHTHVCNVHIWQPSHPLPLFLDAHAIIAKTHVPMEAGDAHLAQQRKGVFGLGWAWLGGLRAWWGIEIRYGVGWDGMRWDGKEMSICNT